MSKKRYFRNKVEINGIEPEALWSLHGLNYQLVNRDEFSMANVKENEGNFYEVWLGEDAEKHL